jgi:hypothetical protein
MTKSSEFSKIGGNLAIESFTQIEKMELYMELISVHRQLGNFEEANNFMQEALSEFKARKDREKRVEFCCYELNN